MLVVSARDLVHRQEFNPSTHKRRSPWGQSDPLLPNHHASPNPGAPRLKAQTDDK